MRHPQYSPSQTIPPDQFIFPEALKQDSPIHRLIQTAKVLNKPILISSGEMKANEIFDTINQYGADPNQNIIILYNSGNHWTVFQGSKTSGLKAHEIRGDGYCGLSAGIFASTLIQSPNSSNLRSLLQNYPRPDGQIVMGIVTSPDGSIDDQYKATLLNLCFGVENPREDPLRKKARDSTIKLIENKGNQFDKKSNEDLYLLDDDIMEVVKHNNWQNYVNIDMIEFFKSFSWGPHLERKMNFVNHLNSLGDAQFTADIRGLEGVSSETLLSKDEKKGLFEYTNITSCTNVLTKFTNKLNPGFPPIDQRTFSAFHKLMAEVIEDKDFIFNFEQERNFSRFQNSFDGYFNANFSRDEKCKKEYELRKNEINKNLTEKSLPLIQAQTEKFLELTEDDLLKKSFQGLVTNFYSNLDNPGDTFKNKINKLRNCFANLDPSILRQGDAEHVRKKSELYEVSAFRARRDKSFIEEILPDVNKFRPESSFRGWGLKIEFNERDQIFIGGKEVKQIVNKGGRNIIEDLRKDFPDDAESFQLGVLDFFRNTESAQLIYVDSNTQPLLLEKNNKKTLILDDSPQGFKVLEPSHNDKLGLSVDGVPQGSQNAKLQDVAEGPIRYAPPPAPMAVHRVGGPKPSAQEMLKEIKKHIDIRFELIEEKLKNPNAVIVIPGFYDNSPDGYKHYLGSGNAKGQWLGVDATGFSGSQCEDYMNKKIKALKKGYSEDRILFGNVGVKLSEGLNREYYLPQYPMLGKFEGPDLNVQLDRQQLTIAQGELLYKYASLCKKLKLTPKINGTTYDARIEEYRQFLFIGANARFKNKEFYHVWGANVENFNIQPNSSKIVGGGQAQGFREQKNGIIGIVTTPLGINSPQDLSKLSEVCKTYGQAPSQKPGTAVVHRKHDGVLLTDALLSFSGAIMKAVGEML